MQEIQQIIKWNFDSLVSSGISLENVANERDHKSSILNYARERGNFVTGGA